MGAFDWPTPMPRGTSLSRGFMGKKSDSQNEHPLQVIAPSLLSNPGPKSWRSTKSTDWRKWLVFN